MRIEWKTERTCKACGTAFMPGAPCQKFCKRIDCFNDRNAKRMKAARADPKPSLGEWRIEKPCPACGCEYVPDSKKQKFCKRPECYNARASDRMRQIRTERREHHPLICGRCERPIGKGTRFPNSWRWCRDCAEAKRQEELAAYNLRKKEERLAQQAQEQKDQKPVKPAPTAQEKADMLRAAMRKLGF